MSASVDPVQAMLSIIRERRRITRADIEALVDAVVEQQTTAFVRDAQQAGHTAAEVESLILKAQRAMLATGDTTLCTTCLTSALDRAAMYPQDAPCNENKKRFENKKIMTGGPKNVRSRSLRGAPGGSP